MQHIFHHNSSGNNAFTGELLSREVLRAISLHPIKKYEYQYRLHNFLNLRKIVDLRQRYLELKREVYKLKTELISIESNSTQKQKTSPSTSLKNEEEIEVDSEFDNIIFNKKDNLSQDLLSNRFLLQPSLSIIKSPQKREHRYDFDFFTRSLFSSTYISPKRGLEGFWKRSLIDSVRQIMDEINQNSIERGRLIDFKDILYGYSRHHPLFGLDYVIDILLVYRKYEGRKMTVPVRRHAYVRNSYSKLLFREDNLQTSIYFELPLKYRLNQSEYSNNLTFPNAESESSKKSLFKRFIVDSLVPGFLANYLNAKSDQSNNDSSSLLSKATQNLQKTQLNFFINKILSSKTINFVLPLTGRWEIFKRFMQNYENICLKTNENTKLIIVLFENDSTKLIYDEESGGFLKQSEMIRKLFDKLREKYPHANEQSLSLLVNHSKFSRSIGCELGAASFGPRDLIFFIDVDIYFTSEFLLRTRLNTIEFKQVYYPIVYSEYDPDDSIEAIKVLADTSENPKQSKVRESHLEFNLDTGYWRQFGFGIVAVYNSDLRRVGGFDTSIVGWGKEDVDLYEKFIKSNLTIFRSIDPGLIHVFHKIECDPTLAEEQMIMCMGSKSTSIASQRVLANLIYEKKLYRNKPKFEHSTYGYFNNSNFNLNFRKTSTVKDLNRLKQNINIEKHF